MSTEFGAAPKLPASERADALPAGGIGRPIRDVAPQWSRPLPPLGVTSAAHCHTTRPGEHAPAPSYTTWRLQRPKEAHRPQKAPEAPRAPPRPTPLPEPISAGQRTYDPPVKTPLKACV